MEPEIAKEFTPSTKLTATAELKEGSKMEMGQNFIKLTSLFKAITRTTCVATKPSRCYQNVAKFA